MLGLGTFFYVTLLLINAMAVLSEERFLARIGWSTSQNTANMQQPGYDNMGYGGQQDVGVKRRLIELIGAVRTLMRVPLIFVNLGIILFEIFRFH